MGGSKEGRGCGEEVWGFELGQRGEFMSEPPLTSASGRVCGEGRGERVKEMGEPTTAAVML